MEGVLMVAVACEELNGANKMTTDGGRRDN